jgi:predicted alpha/beta superfamily hydrolase
MNRLRYERVTNRYSPLLRLLLALLSFSYSFAQTSAVGQPTAQTPVPSVIDDLRLHQLRSEVFGNTRVIRVLLPPGYNERANRKIRYPVLYLNDGQNLFDVSTSVFNPLEWQADEALDRLIRAREIEPIIVVGIDNAGRKERANEYLPYPDAYLRPPLPSPEGSKYPDFLTREVMPLINRQYRTKVGAEHTGLGGSSYGALIALYTVIAKPDTFGRLLLESPSLYVSDGKIIKGSRNIQRWPRRIYIGIGTNEGGHPDCQPGGWDQEAVQDVLKLKRGLEAAGLGAERLKVVVEECAAHNEAAWAKRLPEALKFLYGSPPHNNGRHPTPRHGASHVG